MIVEKRAKDAEMLASRILEDSEQRAKEMEGLKQELERAKEAEISAKRKLTSLVCTVSGVVMPLSILMCYQRKK